MTVNGVKVAPDEPVPIRPGDWIGAGPALLRVAGGGNGARSYASAATLMEGPNSRVVMPASVVLGLHELRHIARISAARTQAELATELLTCAISLTRHARGAIANISALDDRSVELVATRTSSPGVREVDSLSRSLLRAAVASGVAVFDDRDEAGVGPLSGHSIIESSIHAACCVRLFDEGDAGPSWVLYLDCRGQEPRPHDNAADVAGALGSIAAACLARLAASDLQERHAGLQVELRGARSIQEMLLPPRSGEMADARVRYEILSLPGRVVAGDLVDVLPLPDGRVAVVIGDVMGKGAPAGMLMSAIQARLAQGMSDGIGLARLVTQINRDTLARCPGVIVSLWVGIIDSVAGRLRYVNAGHGLCVIRDGAGNVRTLDEVGGPILGADEHARYDEGEHILDVGARLVLFTDGLVEQPDPLSRMLGIDRVADCVQKHPPGAGQIEAIRTLLETHAAGRPRIDDITLMVVDISAKR